MRNVIFGLLAMASVASAQPPADLQFEVASVRAAGPLLGPGLGALAPKGSPIPAAGWMSGGPGTSDPERLSYTRVLMMSIVRNAFPGYERDQILGPDWLLADDNPEKTGRYDIAAKVPPGTTKEQFTVMLRNLLKSRLGLVFHYDKKEFDVLALVIAKNGSKLKPAQEASGAPSKEEAGTFRTAASLGTFDPDGFPVLPPGRPGVSGRGSDGANHMSARMQSAADIARFVGFEMRNPHVADKTGLTGKYDFKILYTNRPGGILPAPGSNSISDPIDDLPTALEKQLGLKLERTKAMLDVLVVDHLDQVPTEN